MAIYAAFTIDQGASFESTITIVGSDGLPMILSGKSVHARIRKSFSATAYRPFTCAKISESLGQVSISLTAQQTSGLVIIGESPADLLLLKPGRYVYDVIVSSGNPELDNITLAISSAHNITRVLEGQIEVTPSVTR